jgi:hypothetical protein
VWQSEEQFSASLQGLPIHGRQPGQEARLHEPHGQRATRPSGWRRVRLKLRLENSVGHPMRAATTAEHSESSTSDVSAREGGWLAMGHQLMGRRETARGGEIELGNSHFWRESRWARGPRMPATSTGFATWLPLSDCIVLQAAELFELCTKPRSAGAKRGFVGGSPPKLSGCCNCGPLWLRLVHQVPRQSLQQPEVSTSGSTEHCRLCTKAATCSLRWRSVQQHQMHLAVKGGSVWRVGTVSHTRP